MVGLLLMQVRGGGARGGAKEVGYCQGSPFMVELLLMQFRGGGARGGAKEVGYCQGSPFTAAGDRGWDKGRGQRDEVLRGCYRCWWEGLRK